MQLGRMTRGKIAAVALVAATAGGGAGAAWAASTSSASAAAPTPSTTAPAASSTGKTATTPSSGHKAKGEKAKKAKSVLDRTDHATVELRKGTTWVTDTYDRGTVTAASGSSITLHRPDGQNVTIAISPTTKFKGITAATQLVTGKQALVISAGRSATHIAERS